MKSPLVPSTIAFICGIFISSVTNVSIGISIMLIIFTIIALIWCGSRGHYSGVLVLLLWFSLGVMRMAIWQGDAVNGVANMLTDESQSVSVHGIITSQPHIKIRKNQTQSTVCELTLLHKKNGREWTSIKGKLQARFINSRLSFTYGDEIIAEGQWSRVPAPTNPGQFNWRAVLARKRIWGIFTVKPHEPVLIVNHNKVNPLVRASSNLRKRWSGVMNVNFTSKDAGLLRSLVLGQREELNPLLKDAFVKTGTMHLLVISGFHIGVIGLLLECILRLLYLPRSLRMMVSAVVLVGYCVLTGMSPPVMRATLMACMVLGALALDRVIAWLNLLAMAALIILIFNPMQLHDPGFQLSFMAVLSILVILPRWRPVLTDSLKWIRPNWLGRYIAFSFCVSSAIWLGLSPVLARYFSLITPVSVIANLVISPLMGGVVVLAFCMLVTSLVLQSSLPLFSVPIEILLDVIYFCVQYFYKLPGGHYVIARPTTLWLIAYYLLLGLTVVHHKIRMRKRYLLMLWICGGMLWAGGIIVKRMRQSRWCELVFLDVGHGDSAVIRSPGGKIIVIDAGTQDAGRFRVLSYLQEKRLMNIDWLIITHSDEDHMGGAIALLEAVKVRRLLTNGSAGDTMTYFRTMQLVREKSIAHNVVYAGTKIHVEPGFSIDVLHPPKDWKDNDKISSNDHSVVLRLVHGNNAFLFTGDIEEEGLPILMKSYPDLLEATFLKVPHHGSRLGKIGDQFFDAVNPDNAVISVGRTHHLPASSTVENLEKTGARVITTREAGAIFVLSDGSNIKIETFKEL